MTDVPGTRPNPSPRPNDHPPVLDAVIADLRARARAGAATYGTPLRPFNGRDALTDAYQEALDLAMYLRQALAEREALRPLDPVAVRAALDGQTLDDLTGQLAALYRRVDVLEAELARWRADGR